MIIAIIINMNLRNLLKHTYEYIFDRRPVNSRIGCPLVSSLKKPKKQSYESKSIFKGFYYNQPITNSNSINSG